MPADIPTQIFNDIVSSFDNDIKERTGMTDKEFKQTIQKVCRALSRPMSVPKNKMYGLIVSEYRDPFGNFGRYNKMNANQIRKFFWSCVNVDTVD